MSSVYATLTLQGIIDFVLELPLQTFYAVDLYQFRHVLMDSTVWATMMMFFRDTKTKTNQPKKKNKTKNQPIGLL